MPGEMTIRIGCVERLCAERGQTPRTTGGNRRARTEVPAIGLCDQPA